MENKSYNLTTFPQVVKGKYINSKSPNETLLKYKIKIEQKIEDSYKSFLETDYLIGTKSANNDFSYVLEKYPIDGEKYKFTFSYVTSGGYESSEIFYFIQISEGQNGQNFTIQTFPNDTLGYIKVQIIPENSNFTGNLIIRRASAESEYKIWEDIKIIQGYKQESLVFIDRLVKSGVFYKYAVARLKSDGWRGKVSISSPSACFFEDIFLMSKEKQLRVRFNPTISNLKTNYSENVVTTLDSKYPFIIRNGHNKYKTFQIGGLITSFMDVEKYNVLDCQKTSLPQENGDSNSLFSSPVVFPNNKIPEDELKEFSTKKEIQNYNFKWKDENGNLRNDAPAVLLEQYNDYKEYIYERDFRQKVLEFLEDFSIKLFRSTTEGNMLVVLTNISIEPLNELGRMLYSFTAQAVEIDDYSVFNCDRYNIQKIGQYIPIIKTEKITGQIIRMEDTSNSRSINIFNAIRQKYATDDFSKITKEQIANYVDNGILKTEILYLTSLKLEIFSPPAPINANKEYCATGGLFSGYIIEINNQKQVIKAFTKWEKTSNSSTNSQINIGILELSNLKIPIKSLKVLCPKVFSNNGNRYIPVKYQIDYVAEAAQSYQEFLPIQSSNYMNPGQLFRTFKTDTPLREQIIRKNNIIYLYDLPQVLYEDKNEDLKGFVVMDRYITLRELTGIKSVSFDTEQNVVVAIKTTKEDNDWTIHRLPFGYLNFNPPENDTLNQVYIEDLQICGIYHQAERHGLSTTYDSLEAIENNGAARRYMTPDYYFNVSISNGEIEGESINSNDIQIQNNNANLNSTTANYIYFRNQWCQYDVTNKIIKCPVDAIINYVYAGNTTIYKIYDSEG